MRGLTFASAAHDLPGRIHNDFSRGIRTLAPLALPRLWFGPTKREFGTRPHAHRAAQIKRQPIRLCNVALVRSNDGRIIRPHRIGQLGRIDPFAGRPFREIWWPISRHGTPPFKYRSIDGLIYIGVRAVCTHFEVLANFAEQGLGERRIDAICKLLVGVGDRSRLRLDSDLDPYQLQKLLRHLAKIRSIEELARQQRIPISKPRSCRDACTFLPESGFSRDV